MAAALIAALGVLAGCTSDGPPVGHVSGQVTVDGQVAVEGSSIDFIPTDGKSPTAGDRIEAGQYAADVPVGRAKVSIRVPRPLAGSAPATAGPGPGGPSPGGPGGGGLIEESLPPKYNDATELTIDVQPGKNVKDWDLTTK
jgi:hypothetical protein